MQMCQIGKAPHNSTLRGPCCLEEKDTPITLPYLTLLKLAKKHWASYGHYPIWWTKVVKQ